MIEICTVGGFDQVGKNMIAVRVDDETIILDMGLDLGPYIKYTEDNDDPDMSAKTLTRLGAIPDITPIKSWKNVIAIVPTHAHLDHIGAIPYLANKYKKAPIICSGFTKEVIKSICDSSRTKIKNKIKKVSTNSKTKIGNITIEFINVTHSTPQSAIVALHTKYGTIVYATDFKFDNTPTLGEKTNIHRLKEIGNTKNVLCLIMDALGSDIKEKTESELTAKEMLNELFKKVDSKKNGIIITTFSSHLARLKAIIGIGKKLNRKIVFLGRSLSKYVIAGQKEKIIDFEKDVELCKYQAHISRKLKQINKKKSKYLVVCTGHQGEKNSILPKIVDGTYEYNVSPDDMIVFSCRVIPNIINEENRKELEKKLKLKKARIYKGLHTSGHAGREDLKELISYIKPEKIIPCHGGIDKTKGVKILAGELGIKYKVKQMSNGKILKIVT